MITRRDFLRNTAKGIAGLSLSLAAIEIISPQKIFAARGEPKLRWVFLVDTYKCVGCGFCVKACKLENEIPYDANVTRTWVERYVLTRDGRIFADTPKGARDGFTTSKIDLGLGRFQDIKKEDIEKRCEEHIRNYDGSTTNFQYVNLDNFDLTLFPILTFLKSPNHCLHHHPLLHHHRHHYLIHLMNFLALCHPLGHLHLEARRVWAPNYNVRSGRCTLGGY